jgi:hypothetical protein
MALELERRDAGSIATIKALPSAALDDLVSAMKSAPLISDPQKMANHLAKRVPSIPAKRLIAILETLYTLYYIRDLSGVKHGRFLQDVVDGFNQSRDTPLTEKDLLKLRNLLEQLLSIDTLKMISKAAQLQRDDERLYCKARILSDIRPVFNDNVSTRPVGAVLTHGLRIGYHEGGDHKEFHVVLDSDDLDALEEVVHRAQAKDKSLREFLADVKLPDLGE